MGRTWARRPRRRSTKHGRYAHAPIRLRLCCEASSKDPHRPGCIREPVTCGDKQVFSSPSDARRRVRVLVAETDHGWRTYECPSCGLWHLTTSLD